MTEDGHTSEDIEGLPIADAVDAVVGRENDHPADERSEADPQAVRTALERVAVDGIVRRTAVEDALAHLSKVVATPETRVELAAIELKEAREVAGDVSDVDVVADRLDRFEERLASVETQVASVGEQLQAVVGRDSETPLGEIALELQRVHEAANAAHRAADELTVDIEEFESWLGNEAVRTRDLEADVDGLEEFLDGIDATTEAVSDSVGDGGSTRDDGGVADDVAAVWVDAVLRHRVSRLLVEDLTTELDGLRELARRDGDVSGGATASEGPTLEELAVRIEDLDGRRTSLDDRLEQLARPEWHERFGDQLSAFDSVLDEVRTPVEWGVVQRHLETHQQEIATR